VRKRDRDREGRRKSTKEGEKERGKVEIVGLRERVSAKSDSIQQEFEQKTPSPLDQLRSPLNGHRVLFRSRLGDSKKYGQLCIREKRNHFTKTVLPLVPNRSC
jgi:hypothetical protein